MTTITAVAESLGEAPAEQALAPRLVTTGRGRGHDFAVIISIGIAEAAWCAILGWAIWRIVF